MGPAKPQHTLNPKYMRRFIWHLLYPFFKWRLLTPLNCLFKIKYRPTFWPQYVAQLKKPDTQSHCFIIGNGPSLRISDLQKLHEKNLPSFAFNKIYLAYGQTDFRPTYYMVEDPLVGKQNRHEITQHYQLINIFPLYLMRQFPPQAEHFFYDIDLRQDWPAAGPAISLDPYPVQWGATVTSSAIQIAASLGYQRIFLIGMDFTFTQPQTATGNKGDILINQGEQNHFHPEYRKKGEKWFTPKIEAQTLALQSIARAADNQGIEIVNLTRGGALEIFKRADFDDVLKNL